MLKVRTTAFVVIMMLMVMKHECMEIGFIQKILIFLVMEEKQRKGLNLTILYNG